MEKEKKKGEGRRGEMTITPHAAHMEARLARLQSNENNSILIEKIIFIIIIIYLFIYYLFICYFFKKLSSW